MTSSIICDVCPHSCKLEEGKTGYCGVRKNIGGENIDGLRNLLWDGLPFSRFGEVFGERRYRVWLPGCNLQCWFCAVPNISWRTPTDCTDLQELSPSDFIDEAGGWGLETVDFFGGEPTIHYEYVMETAKLARERGLRTVIETNGCINPWLAETIARSIDEVVIGIKGSASPKLYGNMNMDSRVALDTIAVASRVNPNVWVANLAGPGLRTTPQDDYNFAAWVRKNVRADICVRVNTLCLPWYRDLPPRTATVVAPSEADAWTYSWQVGSRFARGGLTNVQVLDPRVRQLDPWHFIKVSA